MNSEPCRVVVVDDDPFVAEMLAAILDAEGFHVETAEHGHAALAALGRFPDTGLVISDMNMPRMSGLELITEIRKGGSDVPIIILTGNNEIAMAISALSSGASDYLLKDENIRETIVISVAKVLEKHALLKKNRQLMEDLAHKNRQLEHERILARKVQENILPLHLDIPGFETGSFYRASNQIGGDFFDAFETEGHTHFLIGDISGHSTSSALIMAVCKGMFQTLGRNMNEPLDIVTAANRMLSQVLIESGMFLTLVYAAFDKASAVLTVVSAGHNPVYLIEKGGLIAIDSTGPVLGWDPDDTWETLRLPFAPGSLLFLYTDGLVEAKDAKGSEFGDNLQERLATADVPPEELIRRLLFELTDFCGNDALEDDLTVFAIARRR
ncbi:MAG: SpoIIE family protein phosphatase [Deltaproteobacteria bacterium]|nr:SpoIIE family protein phosphatase [Deltaproteobacteria bacterium]